ncbi:MAG: hypothetical protein WD077_13275 [Bacteroidia bacterium]
MRKFLLLLPLLFMSVYAFAQRTHFSGSISSFPKELSKDFSKTPNPAFIESLKKFEDFWTAGSYSEPQQRKIIETAELMYAKRQKNARVVEQYVNNLLAFEEHNIDSSKFNDWHFILMKLLEEDTRKFNLFNQTIEGLFRQEAIYASSSKTWLATNEYSLLYNEQPVVSFGKFDLRCVTKGDTITIFQTSGKLYTSDNIFKGKGGKVLWTRFGLPEDVVYAEMDEYQVDVNQPFYSVDSVTFFHKQFFGDRAIKGRLEDKAFIGVQDENSSYPRFTAFERTFKIDDLAENVFYEGGFQMEGGKLQGIGGPDYDASIMITYNGVPTFRARSKIFTLLPDRIHSSRARCSIYLGEEDSIYHPQLYFQYLIEDKELTASRRDEGLYQAPFFDSYHGLEMYYEGIVWKVEQPMINMKLITNTEGEAIFESTNYFRDTRYDRIQSILDYNPLAVIKHFAERIGTKEFSIQDLANNMGAKPSDIERLVILLSNEGYLYYDINNGWISLKDKLFHYVNSHHGRDDYDVIRFKSIISKLANASLSLETFNLTLQGVPTALLSDSQKTWIVPKDQTIILKKNLDMEFDGHVHSGRFDFYGEKFKLDYKQFRIALDNVDSVKFVFPEKDDNDVTRYKQIKTVLQNVKGYLYIDQPFNKSGLKDFSEYPIFECTKSANVFYDNPAIHQGVYNREEFFFTIRPFTIDSLDNFTIQGLTFGGTLHSANIIPDIESELVIQDDYSLGLTETSPSGGWPLYGGKGTGDMVVNLSNKGFRATGEVEYLASTNKSSDIIFFPDSMNSNSEEFSIPDPGKDIYPKVAGRNVQTHWIPYADTMDIRQKAEPFLLYTENIVYNGDLILTPQRLAGKGELYYKRGIMASNLFAFYRKDIKAETASFKIHTIEDSTLLAFNTPNIQMELNLPNQKLTGTSNLNTVTTEMPRNVYATSLENMEWDIAKENLRLEKGKSQAVEDAVFLSWHNDQDSLRYSVGNADLNLKNYLIAAHEVPLIKVADSHVFPDSQNVYVEAGANMRVLKNSELKTDTLHNLHRIYEASIKVEGRKSMNGSGIYDYVDGSEKTYKIDMKAIGVNIEGQTIATGQVSDSSDFQLDEKFDYKGDVELLSIRKHLNFNGFILAMHKFPQLRTTWFRYNDEIKPDSLYFTIDTATKSEDRLEIFAAVCLATDSQHVYNVFLGRKKQYSHPEYFRAKGVLFYDKARQSFVIADPDKLYNNATEGIFYRFNDRTGDVYAEGPLNLAGNMRDVTSRSAGKVNFSPSDSQFVFDVVMTVNFGFDNTALKLMTDSLQQFGTGLPAPENSSDLAMLGLSTLVEDEKDKEKVLASAQGGLIPDDKALKSTLLFTNVRFVWDQQTESLHTTEKVGLANVDGRSVNKVLYGAIDISTKRAGDKFTILMETQPGQFYYFYYYYGTMYSLSSDKEFITAVREGANKTNKGKYRVRVATKRQKDIFVRDMEI